jgi:hypothetical protein
VQCSARAERGVDVRSVAMAMAMAMERDALALVQLHRNTFGLQGLGFLEQQASASDDIRNDNRGWLCGGLIPG